MNGVSYGPANSVKLKNIQVPMDIEVLYTPKLVYTPVYTENFDGESTVWVAGGTTEEAVLADGKLTVTSIGGDPNINAPEAFGLNCDDIDVIRVKYTNNTDNTSFQIFFTNEANPSYSEAGSFKATCVAGENEIVIETAGNELWTGILSNMRIDLSNGEGSFVVDSISFETVSLSKQLNKPIFGLQQSMGHMVSMLLFYQKERYTYEKTCSDPLSFGSVAFRLRDLRLREDDRGRHHTDHGHHTRRRDQHRQHVDRPDPERLCRHQLRWI